MSLNRWICQCGHELYASTQPDPVEWTDNHTCNFTPVPHLDNRVDRWIEVKYDKPNHRPELSRLKDFIHANYVCSSSISELDLVAICGLKKESDTVIWDIKGNAVSIRRTK